MKYIFCSLLLLLALASPLLSGCKKEESPTTGSLSGTVSPAGSVTRVTAQNSSGVSFSATPDATTGAFSLAGLAAGQYALSFTVASGYKPLTTAQLQVVAGQNTATGATQATYDGSIKSGTMSWTTGGNTYTATVAEGTIDRRNGTFYVKGKATTGTQTDEVAIWRNSGFSGAGNYKLSYAEYRRTTAGIAATYFDRTTTNPLVITQYDEASGTAVGTFSFWGWTGDLGGNSIVVTNGTFSLRF